MSGYFSKRGLRTHEDGWSKHRGCRMPVGGLIVLRLGSLRDSRASGGGIVPQVKSATRCLPRLEPPSMQHSEIIKHFTYVSTTFCGMKILFPFYL